MSTWSNRQRMYERMHTLPLGVSSGKASDRVRSGPQPRDFLYLPENLWYHRVLGLCIKKESQTLIAQQTPNLGFCVIGGGGRFFSFGFWLCFFFRFPCLCLTVRGTPHLLCILSWDDVTSVFLPQGPTSAHVQLIMERLLRRINRTVIGMSRQSPHIVSLLAAHTQAQGLIRSAGGSTLNPRWPPYHNSRF